MYKPGISLVNGEIIGDLLDLCNEYFTNPFVQPYAGARHECMFCGAMRTSQGGAHHSAADCPVIKYQDIAEKHKRFIIKEIKS